MLLLIITFYYKTIMDIDDNVRLSSVLGKITLSQIDE